MAKLSDRLKVLEKMKKGSAIQTPLIIFMPDEALTDEQQRQVDEAEAIGQGVFMIRRATHDPSLSP